MSAWLLALTGGRDAQPGQRLARLWGGYGELRRYELWDAAGALQRLVVKQVDPRTPPGEPDRGHLRKLRSYAVEQNFYTHYAARLPSSCRTAAFWGASNGPEGSRLALEDLAAAGFAQRLPHDTTPGVRAGLRWLARFHAAFLGSERDGLWETGCYWHLATRPDELARVADPQLRRAARTLDQRLGSARFQTLVHGDAKAENFCFDAQHQEVACVDFQYVGGGPGVKDVAYFLGSCLSPVRCQREADAHLDYYFAELASALGENAAPLEAEWRALYPIAWADFYRFLAGWAPGSAHGEHYAEQLTRQVLGQLDAEPSLGS